jgi:hypothetical protein
MKGKVLQETVGILNLQENPVETMGFSIRLAQGKLLGAGLGAGKPLL